MKVLYQIFWALDYADQVYLNEYNFFIRKEMGFEETQSTDQINLPLSAKFLLGSGNLNDFMPGPGGALLVNSKVKEDLIDLYKNCSRFIAINFEGQPKPYFIWIIDSLAQLIDCNWQKKGIGWKPGEVAWLPENFHEIDIIRESRYKNRFFCLVDFNSSSSSFYHLVKRKKWTGLVFEEQWRGES